MLEGGLERRALVTVCERVLDGGDCQTLPCQVMWSGGLFGGVLSVLFVAPHASDDAVGEVAFVDSSGFAAGLAFGGFSGEVGGGVGAGCGPG